MPSQHSLRRSSDRRQHWPSAKRRLCDVVEEMSLSGLDDERKLEAILPVLLGYARALAEGRDADLAGSTLDELVSTLGERCALAVARLDLSALPAQQVTYLDSALRHGLADACRNLDPLGRGPRKLRRLYEAELDTHVEASGEVPGVRLQARMLDGVVGGDAKPALRLLVGHGMTPAEAAWCVTPSASSEDPAETVVAETARRQIAAVIATHPDDDVRDYLYKVAAGVSARRPPGFRDRLGSTLPALLSSLLLAEATETLEASGGDRGQAVTAAR